MNRDYERGMRHLLHSQSSLALKSWRLNLIEVQSVVYFHYFLLICRLVMGYLKARFGITFFANEIRLELIECPIDGCLWRNRFTVSQAQALEAFEPTD